MEFSRQEDGRGLCSLLQDTEDGEKQDGKQVLSHAQNPLIAVGFLSISLGAAGKHAKLGLEVAACVLHVCRPQAV